MAVLTSQQGLGSLEELKVYLNDNGHDVPDFLVETVDDPFADYPGARDAAHKLARHAGNINIVNIAGGTTALQFGVQQLIPQLDARYGAVADRRPFEEQRENPFHVGEWIWIDDSTS